MPTHVHLRFSFLHSFSYHQHDKEWSWSAYRLVGILRNLAIFGGNSGQQTVLDATTDDLRQILPHVVETFGRFMGEVWVTEIQDNIAEIWQ
jgi:hypothetical protein